MLTLIVGRLVLPDRYVRMPRSPTSAAAIDSFFAPQSAPRTADIALPPVEADRDAAGWSAAHGSVRNRARGVARVALGPAGAGLVLSLRAG
jgi:hypothetical protein